MSSRVALTVLPAVAIASVLLLTGCTVPDPEPTDTPTSPSATPSLSAEPTEQPTESAEATPVDIPCTDLVSLDAMYAFNPNFSLIDVWEPTEGSPADAARGFAGTTCRWVNGTSGETIEVTVAQPATADLEAIRAEAETGESVSVSGADAAFFAASGGVGTVTVFDGAYWVTVGSSWFLSAGDAQPIVDEVVSAL